MERALAAETREAALNDALTSLVRSLKDDVVSMRREGFNPAPVEPTEGPRRDPLPSKIVEMIERSVPTQGARSQLKRWARTQLEAGRAVDEVYTEIRDGQE